MVNYFFDTCAIIELFEKKASYMPFGEFPLITTTMNKVELYWWALREGKEAVGDALLEAIYGQEIDNEVIREAMHFRKKNSKKDISYTDAIGYSFAKIHGLLFLTGDTAFQGLPGVKFVK